MSIGTLSSNQTWSSIKYDGTEPTTKFTATTTDQELILFESKEDPTKLRVCNSVVLASNADPLYFSLLLDYMKEDHDFTDDPVYVLDAEDTITLNAIAIKGIKFSNATGAEYYIAGFGYQKQVIL